ncbi:MAG: hypothetical protein CL920_04305 [Deltaproteobacteria bacterium]|nr:hypothetical protein [Deltaproteobacteria bacterium]
MDFVRVKRTPSVRPAVVQLPLFDQRFALVDKGSDAYQTRYRDTNEKYVYIGLISVGAGLVSELNHRIYRLVCPSSRKA